MHDFAVHYEELATGKRSIIIGRGETPEAAKAFVLSQWPAFAVTVYRVRHLRSVQPVPACVTRVAAA